MGGGAAADLKTISALGGYAATAITAITVQNTLGVRAIHPIFVYKPFSTMWLRWSLSESAVILGAAQFANHSLLN